jgi:hypothetical protein
MDKLAAENLIRILYDYTLPVNKEGAQTEYSEAISDQWADFFAQTDSGIMGDFPTLSGAKANELDCLQEIATYCENVNNFFLKPLSGLPIVDLIFRCGTRDLIQLWAMYAGLQYQVNTGEGQTTLTVHAERPNIWGQSTFLLPPGGVEIYEFNIYYSTDNPRYYVNEIGIYYTLDSGRELTYDTLTIPEDGGTQTHTWNTATIPIEATAISLFVSSPEFQKGWEAE